MAKMNTLIVRLYYTIKKTLKLKPPLRKPNYNKYLTNKNQSDKYTHSETKLNASSLLRFFSLPFPIRLPDVILYTQATYKVVSVCVIVMYVGNFPEYNV